MNCLLEDKQHNFEKAKTFLQQAVRAGEKRKTFKELAHLHGISVILPVVHIDKNKKIVSNTAFVIDKKGTVVRSQTKVHHIAIEREYFNPGNEFKVFTLDKYKIGIMICYDTGFFESARTLALQCAELILLPSAWRIEDERLW